MRAHIQRVVVAGSLVMLGCLGGRVASTFVAPPAHAGNYPRWEYHCLESSDNVTTLANQLGDQGWEMSGVSAVGTVMYNRTFWCFKRPKL